MDLLPDCRTRQVPAGIPRGVLGTWLPVYCANCGADGGMVPEEHCTFLFYLCNACAETHGQIAGTLMMPDEVFYQRLLDAQLERYGRPLTPSEWGPIEADPSHPLHTLLREGSR